MNLSETPEAKQLHVLSARAQISEILVRYTQALDRRDEQLLNGCFHPDSTHDHGGFTGRSLDFCKVAMEFVRQLVKTQHHLGSISITVNGLRATAESYFNAYHRMPATGDMAFPDANPNDDVFIGGRYNDEFECRNGNWLISHRIGVIEWWRFESPSDRGNFRNEKSAPLTNTAKALGILN